MKPDQPVPQHSIPILSFQEFTNLLEFEATTDLPLIEATSLERSNWVKTIGVGLQLRINSIGNQIVRTKDVAKKLDLIARQGKWIAGLTLLSIASSQQDRSMIKGISNRN